MIFTSLTFILFFLIVFSVYWRLRGLHLKQAVLLLASVVFYGWWDYRFLLLITLVIGASYFGALGLQRFNNRRIAVASLVITVLLSVLGLFKYANFLFSSLQGIMSAAGLNVVHRHFNIELPVGISFFTFHGISYIVDVYRGKIPVQQNLSKVALYILFFPQLIAGPIVRAAYFMPQLDREPSFNSDEITRGIKLFLIGFVYKAIIADSIAPYVDDVYANLRDYGAGDHILATLGFYAQIYFDFAGYSIMAIGISRMLGYRLPRNFDFPYASLSITEFWRRWHISLSSWLRDYLYIPLGGNRDGRSRQLLNIMITMLLGGLWHGASWNFVIWGGLHGIALASHKLYLDWRPVSRVFLALRGFVSATPISWVITQIYVLLCWVPFRAQTLHGTTTVWKSFFAPHIPDLLNVDWRIATVILAPLLIDTLLVSGKIKLPLRLLHSQLADRPWRIAVALGVLFGLSLLIMPLQVKSFIYFRF